MNLYWLYDLPNWLFGLIVIAFFVSLSVIGLCTTRKWVRRLHRVDHSHNDIVGYFLAAITVFYGITLGLVAIGTWNTYSAVQDKVDAEAQTVAALYRDAGSYGEPWTSELRQDLRDYVRSVIDIDWPLMRKGIVPQGWGDYLERFQQHVISFDPKTFAEEVNQYEVFKQYDLLDAVNTGIPAAIWQLVIIGAFISIIVALFFDAASFAMHFWMTVLLSGFLGLMVFLVGTLDNPFRGKVSVSPEPLELVYQTMTANGGKDKTEAH